MEPTRRPCHAIIVAAARGSFGDVGQTTGVMSKTRIIESVKRLDLEETRALLDGAPELLRVKNNQGRNLLHLACGASCEKLKVSKAVAARMVTFLLERGLDIEEGRPVWPGPMQADLVCGRLWQKPYGR